MSNKYEITGKVKVIGDVQTFPSGFQKREFVVTTSDDKYPQDIKLEAVKDDCAKLDQFAAGDDITVSFNLRGNEYNGKYYVSLSAWKFSDATSRASLPHAPRNQSAPPSQAQSGRDDDDNESIPF